MKLRKIGSRVDHVGYDIEGAIAATTAGVRDAEAFKLVTAILGVLTESQQLRVLAQFGWEPMPVTRQDKIALGRAA